MADMYQYTNPPPNFQPQGFVHPHLVAPHPVAGQQGFAPYLQPEVPFRDLISEDVTLEIRQQPVEALIAIDGKEKTRKPLDPAPILELKVQNKADPAKYFLQSPYLFVCATLVEEEKDQVVKTNDNKCGLVGSVVSSLHRIKDNNNADGGFFVWGDISCRVLGKYRLKFSLFDFRVRGQNRNAVYLKSICTEPFVVVAPKDFNGMKESTLLSRTFQAQGIRLRLRKEPRASAYRNTSSPTNPNANPKKRTFEDLDDAETAGGAVQRPASLQRHLSSTPQSAVPYTAMPYLAAGRQSPSQTYTQSSHGYLMGVQSPQGYEGSTPSPSYLAATLADTPLMPVFTSGPLATDAPSTSGAFSSSVLTAAALSTADFSTDLTTAGLATGPLTNMAFSTVPYPPYPAFSVATDGSVPSSSMTALPLFTSEDNGDHAWTTTAHSNALGLPTDFTSGDYSGHLNLDYH